MLNKSECLVTVSKLFVALAAVGLTTQLPHANAAPIQAFSYTFGNVGQQQDSLPDHYNLGYVFQTTQPLVVTALGALDVGGTSVAATTGMPVALYYSAASPPDTSSTVDGGHLSGTPVPGGSVTVTGSGTILGLDGNAYTSGDGFRYQNLATPIVLQPGTYEIEDANLGRGFQANIHSLSMAAGVSGILNATAAVDGTLTGDDSYTTGWAHGNEPGNFGPNLLVSPVPEPSALLLLAVAGAGLTFVVRRRRSARSGCQSLATGNG